MDVTDPGRWVVGALALVVAGFALGSLSRLDLQPDVAIGLLGSAAVVLIASAIRRPSDR
jgi:hypothetical protein